MVNDSRPVKVIQYMCKTNCDTKQYSCWKGGLECISGCGECCGVSCSNSPGNIDILL